MRERGLRDDAEVFGLRIRSSMKWAFSEMGKSVERIDLEGGSGI